MIGLITGLVGKVTGSWLLPIAGVAAAALVAFGGAQTWRLHTAQAHVAEAQAETAKQRAAWLAQVAAGEKAGREASERYRALEAVDQQRQKDSYENVEAVKASTARVVADLTRQLAGVRATLTAYASGASASGGTAADTVAAAQHRAEALGDVLANCLRVQVELGAGAELEAGNARGLLEAWPVN